MTLEEILNKLLEIGRKPFGKEYTSVCVLDEGNIILRFAIRLSGPDNKSCLETMRTITAKESGLWQFCVDNGMVNGVDRWTLNAKQKSIYDKYITSEKEYTPKINYEYRLIESALKNEDELEQFLLDNIKI